MSDASDDKPEAPKGKPDGPLREDVLYPLRGVPSAPALAKDPPLSALSLGPPMPGLSLFDGDVPRAREPRRKADPEHQAQHSMYLTASGTLTQFNAIMAAIHTTALTGASGGFLKAAIGAALFLHAAASFFLCWAARPLPDGLESLTSTPSDLAEDTFQNYRRGWRGTMAAMVLSAIASALFAWEASGLAGNFNLHLP